MRRRLLLATGLASTLAMPALRKADAQGQPPAMQAASAEERARLAPLIEGARREGRVTYWATVIQPETHDDLAAAFRRHYGLPAGFRVNYTLSQTGALVTRIEQELAAGRVSIDVASIASPTWVFEKVEAGQIEEYDSPEYRAFGKAFEAGISQQRFFAFNGAYIFVPMWNAETLNFNGTSWRDVIGAVPPGRMTIGDAGTSATYLATYVGQRDVLGPQFFRDLAAMRPSFLVRSEQIAARLVSGQDLMAFSGMPTRAFQNNAQGARLRFMLPREGVVLLPQNTFILKGAPAPNAARLWVDFMLSEQGQSILARREALISGRSGFRSPLPEYAPAIDDLQLMPMNWRALRTADMQRFRQEWTGIFRG